MGLWLLLSGLLLLFWLRGGREEMRGGVTVCGLVFENWKMLIDYVRSL